MKKILVAGGGGFIGGWIVKKLGWEPQINLHEGLNKTYEWIENQVQVRNKI